MERTGFRAGQMDVFSRRGRGQMSLGKKAIVK